VVTPFTFLLDKKSNLPTVPSPQLRGSEARQAGLLLSFAEEKKGEAVALHKQRRRYEAAWSQQNIFAIAIFKINFFLE